MTVTLYTGDCREVMRTMASDSVDAVVCDPPYGLALMGKGWDHAVPGVDYWTEALRVAKPGAHLLAFGGTRTFHRMVCAIEDAGWEIRDRILWLYGSGFPKSHNLHDEWRGWGTALKPAHEPIIVARKPLIGTVAANVLAYGTGALNIDGCRVSGMVTSNPLRRNAQGFGSSGLQQGETGGGRESAGRWPANVIHDGSDEVLAGFPTTTSGQPAGVKAGGQGNAFGEFAGGIPVTGFGDSGSAARFFYCAKADRADRNDGCDGLEERPLLWSSGTQSPGTFQAEGTHRAATNNHPTVKPTDLMRYLCRLVTPPAGVVLDPFMGSGSTGRAAVAEGFSFVGIELDPAYVAIARARIDAMQPGLSLAATA